MLRTFRNSVAAIAAASALAAPLAAQTTTAPPVVPAPAAPAAPAVPETGATAPATALPAALTELGITDARVLPVRRGGQRVEGTLPGGQSFRARLDDQSQLRMIGVDEGAALPAEIVSRLVPEAVRSNAIFTEFAQVRGVGRGEQGVMLFGADAGGESIRAGFSADGTLQRFGRGEMDRPRMDRGDDRRDKGDRGDKRDGRKGPGHDRGPMGRDAGADAPRGPGASLDDGGIQRLLNDAGYSQPGTITRTGPRVEVEAVNPEGEPVTVTINPRGVIVRELAR